MSNMKHKFCLNLQALELSDQIEVSTTGEVPLEINNSFGCAFVSKDEQF
jgi:hypothetical protein